jgi:hypothetical protein
MAAARSLHADVLVREERAPEAGAMLRGRQILFLMYDYFKTNVHMALIYSVTDLAKLTYPGGKNMHSFRHRWGLTTASMSDKLNHDTLASILLQRIESSNGLRGGIAYYHRRHEGHSDKTYAFLKQCMDR